MLAILHTSPPCKLVSPEIVAPPEVTPVAPKFGSAASSVITVFVYVCAATVPAQLSSHSVPVPHPVVITGQWRVLSEERTIHAFHVRASRVAELKATEIVK